VHARELRTIVEKKDDLVGSGGEKGGLSVARFKKYIWWSWEGKGNRRAMPRDTRKLGIDTGKKRLRLKTKKRNNILKQKRGGRQENQGYKEGDRDNKSRHVSTYQNGAAVLPLEKGLPTMYYKEAEGVADREGDTEWHVWGAIRARTKEGKGGQTLLKT